EARGRRGELVAAPLLGNGERGEGGLAAHRRHRRRATEDGGGAAALERELHVRRGSGRQVAELVQQRHAHLCERRAHRAAPWLGGEGRDRDGGRIDGEGGARLGWQRGGGGLEGVARARAVDDDAGEGGRAADGGLREGDRRVRAQRQRHGRGGAGDD